MSAEQAWSYSALRNFETCPKRYAHYNVLKDVKEPETAQLREGNALHAHFDARIKHGTQLPLGHTQHEGILARFVAAPGTTYSEQKLALTSAFTPVAFFGRAVWFRTVIDAAKVHQDRATIADWKTGKPTEDETQLKLMAVTMFIHQPQVQRVRAALVFVNHESVVREEYLRSDQTEIWAEILPRVKKMQTARATQEFPPTPSGLCKKYCAVESCPYHGRGG